MKEYYYTDGSTKFGPFKLDELAEQHISRTTLVWSLELNEWKEAGSIPELKELFKNIPPPITTKNTIPTTQSSVSQTPPKSWLVESILVTVLCCVPFGIAGIVNASRVESRFEQGDLEGARKASDDARKWTTYSFIFGLIIASIYMFFTLVGLGK